MTKAQKAAEEIVNAICDNRKSWTIAQFAAIITAHCGDGEDKERMDEAEALIKVGNMRADKEQVHVYHIENHWTTHKSLRSAIDAERRKEGE